MDIFCQTHAGALHRVLPSLAFLEKLVLSNIYILMVNVKNNCLLLQESYHTKILHLRDMPISQFGTEALAHALPYDLCC